MEDGLNEAVSCPTVIDNVNNGVDTTIMSNFPEGTVTVTKDHKSNLFEVDAKLNGSVHSSDEADDDSETDALVIDESVPKRRVKKQKRSIKSKGVNDISSLDKESEVVVHSNPYFNESIFELSQQHHNSREIEAPLNTDKNKTIIRANKLKKVKPKNSPKLREYAQYLGLQPAVQFKCSKCQQAGFESLPSLNEHLLNCTADPNATREVQDNSVSSFKLTRRVFLCSACGTYYENWNLYMHMVEFHRRYICLYCLGMFSVLEDLCEHIQSRHNWEPQQRETPDDFFKEYKEPCFIICCECKQLFNERDNFFYHNCVQCDNSSVVKNINSKNSKNKSVKQQIRPENHVTGDSIEDNCREVRPETNIADVISDPRDTESIIPMVRSEHKNTETSEIVPEVPSFNPKNTEMNSQTSLADLDQIETSQDLELAEKHVEPENHDSKLDESLSMETNDKQASCNLTSEFVNNSSTEATLNNKNCEDDVESVDDFQTEGYNQSSRDSDLKSVDEEHSDLEDNMSEQFDNMNGEETRKVPKLSLKLPKLDALSNVEPADSDESEKLEMEVDQIESENECYNHSDEKLENISGDISIPVAGPEVAIVELELEQPLDKFDIKLLLQKCLLATVPVCVYCNHARKIAVNGKQLGLHAIAEHRYSAIVNSITAEELIPESFVSRIKECLNELENTFFNLESNWSEEAVTFSHVFECFQCRYATNVHKELYLHNRKMHTKNLLICIMCKSNFYSYSELICHLCPGDYVLNHELQFRCCMCFTDDLPSSFRLMVHLRKRHHTCDVCLEMCHNQYKLSNHVWKHKLHHFCYRCGIAYRNKQDITRHLFWKHGTESVLCKKCLQKKWPHVFHFCIPPSLFTCDECNLNFSKAVYLKVHKRIHFNEKPHLCTFDECGESFVSKKLLQKHEKQHFEPQDEKMDEKQSEILAEDPEEDKPGMASSETTEEKTEDKPKPKIDVYDLPELNLSESSDSEFENETAPKHEVKKTEEEDIIETLDERTLEVEQELANNVTIANGENQVANHNLIESSVPILESIWDDFKIYQAKKEKIDNLFGDPERVSTAEDETDQALTADVALRDHDYFYNPEMSQDTNVITEVEPDLSQRVDHDYCTPKGSTDQVENNRQEIEKVDEEAKKPSLDSSSSDSDSSSCSCGSNCSCSTSSSSSSSSDSTDSDSSTEEGRRKQQARRDKKKKLKVEKKEEAALAVGGVVVAEKKPVLDAPILETDLDTTESETDEEFYDKQPQILAKKLLEEKRNQLMAEAGHIPNGGFFENSRNSTPSLPEEIKPKKKSKSKKRKKKKSERREVEATENIRSDFSDAPYSFYQTPTVAPLTISLNKMSPLSTQGAGTPPSVHIKLPQEQTPIHDSEVNKRASKRRRVPNKFYGYSSEEEGEKQSTPSAPKWKKTEMQASHYQPPPLLVPPITIKTGHAISQPTVEPITIRPAAKSGELRVHQRQSQTMPRIPPLQINAALLAKHDDDDERDSDSNESAVEETEDAVAQPLKETKNVQLYCYCRCPYDEVSEMIGCDSHDCAIEWFHFECVGIMVAPKGQWFCPDCRKRKQQRRELSQA